MINGTVQDSPDARARSRAKAFVLSRIEEMLDPRADVTRRARTLSPRTALAEALDLAQAANLTGGATIRGEVGTAAGHGVRNLPEVVDEAVELLRQDRVVAALGIAQRDAMETAVNRLKAKDLRAEDLYAVERLLKVLSADYHGKLSAIACNIISKEPKRLELLEEVISSLVADLRACGWSDEALVEVVGDLWKCAPEDVMDALSGKVTQACPTFLCRVKVIVDAFEGRLPTELEGAVLRTVESLGDSSEHSPEVKHMMEVRVEAQDQFTAAREVTRRLTDVFGAATVFLSESPVEVWRKYPVEVYSDEMQRWEEVTPKVPLVREPRIPRAGDLARVMTSVWNHNADIGQDPVLDAVRFFERGAATVDLETRFVLLWFGIERMVSGSRDYKGSLEAAARNLVPPAITLGKLRREVSALCDGMLLHMTGVEERAWWDELGWVHPITNEKVVNRWVVFDRLMGKDDGYRRMLSPFYVDNPKLVQWSFKLRKVLGVEDGPQGRPGKRGERIAEYLEASCKRTERQVLRLYRTRNGVAHSGSRPNSINDLAQHAAFYLTNLIAIAVAYRDDGLRSPAGIFTERRADYLGAIRLFKSEEDDVIDRAFVERPRAFVSK